MTVTLYWPDGTTLTGEDAADVLTRLGRLQWTPLDLPAMQRALADRAWNLHRVAIDPDLPADEFLTALDAAGVCAVDHSGTPVKPPWRPMRKRPPAAT